MTRIILPEEELEIVFLQTQFKGKKRKKKKKTIVSEEGKKMNDFVQLWSTIVSQAVLRIFPFRTPPEVCKVGLILTIAPQDNCGVKVESSHRAFRTSPPLFVSSLANNCCY